MRNVKLSKPYQYPLNVADIGHHAGILKVEPKYTGNAVIIARSSDSATQPIAYLDNGFLDMATMKSFIGIYNGQVSTMYTQNPTNSKTLTPPVSWTSPRLIVAGSVLRLNSLPAIDFSLAKDVLAVSAGVTEFGGNVNANTNFIVGKINNISTGNFQRLFTYTNHSSGGVRAHKTNDGSEEIRLNLIGGSSLGTGILADTNPHVFAFVTNGTSNKIFVDGVLIATGGSSVNASITRMTIGNDTSESTPFSGYIAQSLHYNSVLPDTQILDVTRILKKICLLYTSDAADE